jgi:hypothetical protein
MTGQEHFLEAEQCLGAATVAATDNDYIAADLLLRQGQVHATLALATATAWPGRSAGGS